MQHDVQPNTMRGVQPPHLLLHPGRIDLDQPGPGWHPLPASPGVGLGLGDGHRGALESGMVVSSVGGNLTIPPLNLQPELELSDTPG